MLKMLFPPQAQTHKSSELRHSRDRKANPPSMSRYHERVCIRAVLITDVVLVNVHLSLYVREASVSAINHNLPSFASCLLIGDFVFLYTYEGLFCNLRTPCKHK